jgi:paraquat-inducible protein A
VSAVLGAAQQGLVSCATCGLLSRPTTPARPGHCARCGGELHWRHPHSIQHTWALTLAAAICFIPANALPVMVTDALGTATPDTIMGGVVFLFVSGSWPLGVIVLIASVMIPLGKLLALFWLLVGVQRRALGGERERMRTIRLVRLIGRWSMLDVFVDTFTVALVQLQPVMSVQPGPGVVFFAAVVVLTMLAAETFDPRLLWDGNGTATAAGGLDRNSGQRRKLRACPTQAADRGDACGKWTGLTGFFRIYRSERLIGPHSGILLILRNPVNPVHFLSVVARTMIKAVAGSRG